MGRADGYRSADERIRPAASRSARRTARSSMSEWSSAMPSLRQPGRPNTADQLRGAHDLALARGAAGRGMADHDAPARLQPPLVCCIRLFYSAVRFPTTSSSAVPRTRPDRTPDSLRGARLRDPGGCGTARITEPAKPARLRRPKHGGRPPAARSGAMAPHLEPELNRGRPRDQAYEMHLLTRARRPSVAGDSRPNGGGGAACAWDPEPSRRVHTRGGFRFVVHPRRSRTPGISCERPIRSTLVSFIPLILIQAPSRREAGRAESTPAGLH